MGGEKDGNGKVTVHQFWYALDDGAKMRDLNLWSMESILGHGHKLTLWTFVTFCRDSSDTCLAAVVLAPLLLV